MQRPPSRFWNWLIARFWGAFDNVISPAILIGGLGLIGAGALWIWNVNWPAVVVVVVVTILYGWLSWLYRNRLQSATASVEDALRKTEKLTDAQLSFMVNMASYVRKRSEPSSDIKPVFEVFLRALTEIFSNTICRASILLPDKDEHSLEVFAHYNMPAESLNPARFPIDDRFATRTSVAGHTYLRREVLVIRVFRQGGVWATNRPDLYQFRASNMVEPSYRSFASIPIIDSDDRCLGVLCIDSTTENTFDGESVSELLYDLGVSVAAGLVIYQHIPRRRANRTSGGL
jgi:hypothetical protein